MTAPNELPHEPRFRFDGEEVETLLSEWRNLGRDCMEELERFTRERPAESLAIAFLTGAFLGAFLRRR